MKPEHIQLSNLDLALNDLVTDAAGRLGYQFPEDFEVVLNPLMTPGQDFALHLIFLFVALCCVYLSIIVHTPNLTSKEPHE